MIVLINSSLGIYWCSDCGNETSDLGHYCLPDNDIEDIDYELPIHIGTFKVKSFEIERLDEDC